MLGNSSFVPVFVVGLAIAGSNRCADDSMAVRPEDHVAKLDAALVASSTAAYARELAAPHFDATREAERACRFAQRAQRAWDAAESSCKDGNDRRAARKARRAAEFWTNAEDAWNRAALGGEELRVDVRSCPVAPAMEGCLVPPKDAARECEPESATRVKHAPAWALGKIVYIAGYGSDRCNAEKPTQLSRALAELEAEAESGQPISVHWDNKARGSAVTTKLPACAADPATCDETSFTDDAIADALTTTTPSRVLLIGDQSNVRRLVGQFVDEPLWLEQSDAPDILYRVAVSAEASVEATRVAFACSCAEVPPPETAGGASSKRRQE